MDDQIETAKVKAEEKAKAVTVDILDILDSGRFVSSDKKRKTWQDYVGGMNALGFSFRLNELDDQIEVNGKMLTDGDEKEIYGKLHEINLPNNVLADQSMTISARENRFHPVKNYLEALEWNGKDNIQELCCYLQDSHDLINYRDGSQRSMIHVGLLRWLVGACAKVYEPSRAFNPVLILDGEEGKGKSYFVEWLCSGLPDLYYEGEVKPGSNDHLGYLATKWIWEISEFGSTITHSNKESLKEFLTKKHVTWRPAYAHHALRKPALSSWIGTVNFDGSLLTDATGNRRFVPVEILDINRGYEKDIEVDQIWAQAYRLYRSGEPWVMTPEEKEEKQKITESYQSENTLEDHISQNFTLEPKNRQTHMLTIDIQDRLKKTANLDDFDVTSQKLSSVLTKLKIKRGRFGAGKLRGWFGVSPKDDLQIFTQKRL